MKRIIPFIKLRFLMFGLSIFLITGFWIGTIINGGITNGIDFAGGWNIQVQFAPVAFTIDYEGDKNYEITILNNKLTLFDVKGDIKLQVGQPLDLHNYATIGDLADELEKIIEGVTVTIRQYKDVSPLKIIAKDAGAPLNRNTGILVHVPVQDKKDLFAPDTLVRKALSSLGKVTVQHIGDNPLNQMYMLKMKEADILTVTNGQHEGTPSSGKVNVEEVENQLKKYLTTQFKSEDILINKSDFVGPTFSQELRLGALWSILLSFVLMLTYITVRFKFGYGLGAVLALVHDVSLLLGIMGTLRIEFSSATLASILTLIGYSINDTIVVFDRIRDNMGLLRDQKFDVIIDTSITQSLSRTMITSLTTLIAVITIYIFTTGDVKDFAFNLIVGIVIGTYSSIFVASPILFHWQRMVERRKKAKMEAPADKKKTHIKPQKETPVREEEPETQAGKTDTGIQQVNVQKRPHKKKKKKKRR